MRSVTVELGARRYEVVVGQGVIALLGRRLRELGLEGQAALVVDAAVAQSHGAAARESLEAAGLEVRAVPVQPGEGSKSLAGLALLYDALAAMRLERGQPLVAVGGGVVGDLAGLAAATWLRGVPLIHVPTTLLAQVDSALGGKTAINLSAGKNLVGAFHQPVLVLADVRALESLPEREFRQGLGEVVKYGVIRDAALVELLEEDLPRLLARRPKSLELVVERCVRIKARVVEADEREAGEREVLNYGHTLGHALESASDYGSVRHGEAVAIGMQWAGRLAARRGLWRRAELDRQGALLEGCGLPLDAPVLDVEALRAALVHDKKVRAGRLRFVLPERLGHATPGHEVELQEVLEALEARA